MSGRLRRFLHLERARAEAPDAQAGLSAPERFGSPARPERRPPPAESPVRPERRPPEAAGVEGPLPPGQAAGSAAGSRFGRPDLRAPDVAPAAEGAQPFVRCFRCETDNTVFATTCTTCAEELDSPAQRAFNERLWAERLRAREEEERALAEQRAGREKAEAELAVARREMAETLARETARRERDRLDEEAYRDGWGRDRWGRGGWGGGWGWGDPGDGWGGGDGRPLGLRLLALISNPRWRIGVAIGALAAALVAGLLALRARNVLALYAVIAVFAILFSPRRRRGWWR